MQFGYRANPSMQTANSFLLEDGKLKVRAVEAVFLDLKKAFDTVNHDVRINKMILKFEPFPSLWLC